MKPFAPAPAGPHPGLLPLLATRPGVACGLLVALLCGLLADARPAAAQQRTPDEIPLRAAHGGAFLPEGTELLVLRTRGTERRNDRFQPVFIALDRYPRDRSLLFGRDVLTGRRQTARTYPRTQTSGYLYFLYARAPDGTLYWSYSAEKDSLKYDVVNTGVMSVAPIPQAEVRAEIERRLFAEAAPERIVVRMPEDAAADTLGPAAAQQAPERTAQQPDQQTAPYAPVLPADGAPAPPDTAYAEHAAAADSSHAAAPPAADDAAAPSAARRSAAAVPPATTGGVRLSYGVLFTLLAALAGGLAVPGYLFFQARSEAVVRREQLFALRGQLSTLENRCDELTRTAREAEDRRVEIEHKYQLLQATYDALREELLSLQALTDRDDA